MDVSTVQSPELEGLRILFVDDSEDERELFQTRFSLLGAEVVTASSADEAFAVIARYETDVVVCDIALPDADGCDLVRTLRDDEVAAAIPVIAATGLTDQADQDRALAAGFVGFVTKPYGTEDLVAMILHVRSQIQAGRLLRARSRGRSRSI